MRREFFEQNCFTERHHRITLNTVSCQLPPYLAHALPASAVLPGLVDQVLHLHQDPDQDKLE